MFVKISKGSIRPDSVGTRRDARLIPKGTAAPPPPHSYFTAPLPRCFVAVSLLFRHSFATLSPLLHHRFAPVSRLFGTAQHFFRACSSSLSRFYAWFSPCFDAALCVSRAFPALFRRSTAALHVVFASDSTLFYAFSAASQPPFHAFPASLALRDTRGQLLFSIP